MRIVKGYDVNWENEFMDCAHCGEPIESAYGDNLHNYNKD